MSEALHLGPAQGVPVPSPTALAELQHVREAVAEAVADHRKQGHSIVVLRDNEIVWLKPGEY